MEPLHDDDPRGPFLERWAAAFQKLEEKSPDALPLLKELQREDPDDRTVALHIERLTRGELGRGARPHREIAHAPSSTGRISAEGCSDECKIVSAPILFGL